MMKKNLLFCLVIMFVMLMGYAQSTGKTSSSVSVSNDGKFCQGAATVTDIDGNTYKTVQIGKQCWMRENLRTTRYANGTAIPMGDASSITTAYRYAPAGNSSNVSKYGYLYNWPAVMHGTDGSFKNPSGVQGICPDGWHVPSWYEWRELEDYVESQSKYVCGKIESFIAKSLASTEGWTSSDEDCTVGNNPSTNNGTGFSALPAGIYNYGDNGDYGDYSYFGKTALFWSTSTSMYSVVVNYYKLQYNEYFFSLVGSYSANGLSVRCLRD